MNILVIGAHLDDIEIYCGGTLSKAIKSGHKVKALIMSKSGYTNIKGEVQRTDVIAVEEGINGLTTLGLSSGDIEILDYPSMDIPFNSRVVTDIEIRVKQFNPDLIITHHPNDTHQSHEAVAKATIAASRRKNTLWFNEPVPPSGRMYLQFDPNIYIPLSQDELDIKLDAVKCHKSEYTKLGGASLELGEGIKARAMFRGCEVGKRYAECFEVHRMELDFGGSSNIQICGG